MEYNPGLELCGFPPRPSTDQLVAHWSQPPCPHLLQGRPPRLHLREDLLCVSVYRCRTRALDSLFKNQTVINDVNTKGNSHQNPPSCAYVPIPDILHVMYCRILINLVYYKVPAGHSAPGVQGLDI